MENKWEIYKKTLNSIFSTQEIYMKMIIYYYNLVIKEKLNDKNYIRKNYKIDTDFSIFEEYILKTKNVGIFTIFNNIPDIIIICHNNHPKTFLVRSRIMFTIKTTITAIPSASKI